ncbi:uncharacterized protein LOC111133630 isoform X1 [Crassostrea virginica]
MNIRGCLWLISQHTCYWGHIRKMCTKITELPDLEEDGISAEITHICKAPKNVGVDITDAVAVHVASAASTSASGPMEMQSDNGYMSEIFVRHPYKESPDGDPLGGFLRTREREDQTFLHTFCNLEDDGILAKDLKVKTEDILVRLNNKQILGSVEFNHCTVLEIFQTLPIETTIYMEIYNQDSHLFTTIEFLLHGFKNVMVTGENVKLMVESPTVIALEFPRESKFLVDDNGRLSYRAVPNHKTDCSCHFVLRKYFDDKNWCSVYSFQVQKDPALYLCYNGTTLDFTDEKSIPKFRKFDRLQEIFLTPVGKEGMYIYYNQCKTMFVLAPEREAFREEGYGLAIRQINCQQ